MKLSVIIPCFNERATIEQIVRAVRSGPVQNIEIIIVDDGSTDGTVEILREKIAALVAQIIYRPRNQGKGAALRAGFAAASGDVILIQDSDLEYSPADYPILLEPFWPGMPTRFLVHVSSATGRIAFSISGTSSATNCSLCFPTH